MEGMEGGPDDKFASISKRVLDIYSLADVLEACEECAVNWNPVGLKLGLSDPQLEQIDAVTTIPKKRLRRVLAVWLKKDTLPGSPDPSYHTLCHAVATGGENPALADRIAKAHPAKHPASVDDKADIDSISSASAGYYTDEELNRLCSCGECSLQKIITKGCPATGAMSSHRFPLLDIKRLPDGKRQQYIYMIEKEANMINTAFSDLCDEISQSMKDISVGRLKKYCKTMRWFDEAVNERSLYDRLNRCKDIEDVFSVLADICSWFNHHPLKALVDRFGSEEVKEKYAKFVSRTLMTFLKKSITEIPKDGLGEIIEGTGQFRLKIDTTAAHENIRGERLYFLKGSVAEALDISYEDLHIVSIKGGCMEVTFMVPLVIYKELFLPDLSRQALQSITVPINEHHSLIVKSVHWYDSEQQRSREKVFCVNDVATNPQEFELLSTERSSDIINEAIISDVRIISKEVLQLSQEVENLQSNSQDLPSNSTKAPAIVESKQAIKMTLSTSLQTVASLLKRAWALHGKELRILVTGKTGQGKSSLVNGILGAKVAKEGAGAAKCTTEVKEISQTIVGVPVKVFDSPGLQDRTADENEYIRGMKNKCEKLSLVLYCTKMINTRLGDDDKNAMKKLTVAFGEEFWNYAVFVLTFANQENVSRRDERDDPNDPEPHHRDKRGWKELKKRRFQGRLKLWEDELQKFLIEEVKVSPEIARGIPVVPTGDNVQSQDNRRPLRLPDRENWFRSFWKVCCLNVTETCLFLKVNRNRLLVAEENVDEFLAGVRKHDDETSLASNQQISPEDEQEKRSFGKSEVVDEDPLNPKPNKPQKPPVLPEPPDWVTPPVSELPIKFNTPPEPLSTIALSPSSQKTSATWFKKPPLEELPTLPKEPDYEFSTAPLSDQKIEIADDFFKDVTEAIRRKNLEVPAEFNEALKRVSSKELRNWIMSELDIVE